MVGINTIALWIAINVCLKSAFLEGMKGVSSKIFGIPPSSNTTLHFGPAITKFEPYFFGQHKLTDNSNDTWKMKKPNMQIRCRGKIRGGFYTQGEGRKLQLKTSAKPRVDLRKLKH